MGPAMVPKCQKKNKDMYNSKNKSDINKGTRESFLIHSI